MTRHFLETVLQRHSMLGVQRRTLGEEIFRELVQLGSVPTGGLWLGVALERAHVELLLPCELCRLDELALCHLVLPLCRAERRILTLKGDHVPVCLDGEMVISELEPQIGR